MMRNAWRWLLVPVLLLAAGVAGAETRGVEVKLKASENPGAPVAETVRLYGASHALVIGIDKYTNGWPRLSKAVEDARAVADELRRQGFDVMLKTDLTSDQFQKALKDFFAIKGADPDARLLLWFAGHGHTIGGEGFLVPADAPPATTPHFKVAALPMRDFGSLVRLAESKHVLSVFDSCFSGTIFNARAGTASPAITRKTTRPVRQFITAGDAGQQVRDDGSFREYFLRAIRGDEKADFNGDGYVTGEELGLFLNQQVAALTGAAQTPKSGKLHDIKYNEGDFVFALARPSAPEVKVAPPPSGGGGFSLDDLAKQADKLEASKRAWSSRLDEMRKAYGEAEAFERRDVSADLKAAAWERFLAAYGDDNPYSREDEGLRDKARSRQATQKQQVASVVRVPPASVGSSGGSRRVGEVFRDCPDCPEMVVVPSGSFEMGSNDGESDEKPVHRVTIPRAFAVGKYEVTRGEFKAFASAGGYSVGNECYTYEGGKWEKRSGMSWQDPGFSQGDRDPVACVNWEDAQAYVKWLNGKVRGNVHVAGGSGTGPYRLLSESEWEYAARGGTSTKWSCGDGEECLSGVAVYNANSGSKTASVGSKSANGFGLYDMHGNVWEWVADCWNGNYQGAPTDGSAWTTGNCSRRVQRGGSWYDDPRYLRSANRNWGVTRDRYFNYGFRIARTLD